MHFSDTDTEGYVLPPLIDNTYGIIHNGPLGLCSKEWCNHRKCYHTEKPLICP